MSSAPARPLPASLVVVAILVLAEASALIVFAALDLTHVHAARLVLGVGTSVFFLAYAAGQVVAAIGLLRLAHWARGPLVFTQLVQLGLAWGLRSADPDWLAGVLALVALVVLFCVLRPASTKVLYGSEHETDDDGYADGDRG